MSSKKKPSLSPRKLFETEELPHFGFYGYSSPPDFENIPETHRNIILWIGQYAATYDLEKVVQALTDSFEGIWTFDTEVYGRVMLSALGVFARSQNFKLGQEAINTLLRIDSAKQHPSYKSFLKELKIQVALSSVRDDHRKTAEFAEAIREISKPAFGDDDPSTMQELIDLGRLLKSKVNLHENTQKINAYLAKHSVDRFQKEVLQFLKDVKEAQPLPFLELVEKDFTAGKYKPVEANKNFSYKEIEAAFLEDGGTDLGEVFIQKDPDVAEYVKKKQNQSQKKSKKQDDKKPQKKPAPNKITQSDEEEDEEPLKKKKKKDVVTPTTAAKQLETRETLTQLDKASKKLYAHGKDPLSEARRKAPKKVSSSANSKDSTPQSRATSASSSAANSADKTASLIDRRATAQAVEWNNSDEDEEEDEFMEIEEHILNTPKRLLEKRESDEPELISPPGGKTVRRRIKWTTEEEDKLLEGYIRYPLQWARIKRKFDFTGRTGVDLKDKYRNMMKHYDDTQRRIQDITDKINDKREARIEKGLPPDETDSEEEKKRQKSSAKKHARKSQSKKVYSEPEIEFSESESDEEPPVEDDSDDAKKRPRRLSGELAKKKIKKTAEAEEEDKRGEQQDEEETEDLNKTREEEPEEEENDSTLPKTTDKSDSEAEKSAPKKTVKKTKRRKRRYQ